MVEMSMKQMIEMQEVRLLNELDDLTGLFQIMVFLHKYESGNISNFIKDLRLNQQPAYRTLEKLIELGLVAIKFEEPLGRKNFRSKYYYLTETGRKIAKHFVKMFEVYKKMK